MDTPVLIVGSLSLHGEGTALLVTMSLICESGTVVALFSTVLRCDTEIWILVVRVTPAVGVSAGEASVTAAASVSVGVATVAFVRNLFRGGGPIEGCEESTEPGGHPPASSVPKEPAKDRDPKASSY